MQHIQFDLRGPVMFVVTYLIFENATFIHCMTVMENKQTNKK